MILKRYRKPEVVDKGTMLRKRVGAGLQECRTKKALELYRSGKISLWKAARMAGMTYSGALEELKTSNIPFCYEKEDLDLDIRWALKEG